MPQLMSTDGIQFKYPHGWQEDELLSFWYICLNMCYLCAVFHVKSQLIKCHSEAQISHMFICSQSILWCMRIWEKAIDLWLIWYYLLVMAYSMDLCINTSNIRIWVVYISVVIPFFSICALESHLENLTCTYWSLSGVVFYFHIFGHSIIPLLLALFFLCLCWSLIVNFSSHLQPSNDFIAGCFIPVSKPAAWGRFSVLPLLGSEL